VSNPSDATRGRNVAKDAELRALRESQLARGGSSTVRALLTDLLNDPELPTITDARVYENEVAHTLQAVIYDGPAPSADNDKVAANLYSNKPAGVPFVPCPPGTFTGTGDVTDVNGTVQTVTFARVAQIPVWLEIDIRVTPQYAGNPQVVKDAMLAVAAAPRIGQSVYAFGSLRAAPLSVTGVFAVPAMRLGFGAAPAGTVDLPIDGYSLALLDSARILVTVVP
jgi:hypothetical protein